MDNIEIILILLTLIEFGNLLLRTVKLIPPREPEIDKNILKTMYC